MARIRFTDEQLAVIEHEGSHALVNAVAGSGKTSTLVERNARLVLAGADPRRIINIQYNRSAKLTMERKLKERIRGALVPEARTFHSIGLSMMKRLTDLGVLTPATLERSPTVYDQHIRAALRLEWKRVHGRDAYPSQEQLEAFRSFVTRAKADVRTPLEVYQDGDFQLDCAPFPAAVARLDQMAVEKKICFFDDLLSRTYSALAADPSLWVHFSNRVDYVCVDEFQDVNPVQYALLQGLVGKRAHCMAVGDGDQAIYSFRASDVSFINHQFPRDFAPCTRLRMTNTFRYGHATSLIANHIISKNVERDDKLTVAAEGNPETRVDRLVQMPSQPSGLVADLQLAMKDETLRQHAMLVRYYSSSVPYEIELTEAGVPFHVYGREPLLLIPEIASLVAAMSFATSHWVIPSEVRGRFMAAILRSPTLFAPSNVLGRAASMMDEAVAAGGDASDALFRIADGLEDERLNGRLRQRADVVRLLEAGGLMHLPPAKIIEAYLAFTEFERSLSSASATAKQSKEIEQNVSAFKHMASRYSSTHDFLNELGPLAGQREDRPPDYDHVPILSIHRAKGLEWSTVYLPGWSAGNYPRDGEPLEEERRLAYVAVTRAINRLVFLHPADSTLEQYISDLEFIPPDGAPVTASRFLYEAEIGLSLRAADFVASGGLGDGVSTPVRRVDVVERYMEATNTRPMQIHVSPAVTRQRASTRVNPDLVLEPGQHLYHGQQLYRVTKRSFDRFYFVEPMGSGDPRLISLDEPGWSLTPAAVA